MYYTLSSWAFRPNYGYWSLVVRVQGALCPLDGLPAGYPASCAGRLYSAIVASIVLAEDVEC